MSTKWNKFTDEQKKKYSDQNVAMKRAKREAKRRDLLARNMLADFLSAPDAQTKRRVIESFAPHYFVFGDRLNPNNPYEENDDGQMEIQH